MDLFDLVGKVTIDAGDAIDKLYGISTIVDGLIGGAKQFAGDVLETGMGFDRQMSAVQAVLGKEGEDEKNLTRLREFALEQARGSIFTAEETADAYYYMGMAGWKTQEMLDGLPGIMALAASSGEELWKVSDVVTDSLTAFGKGADYASTFADILAAAATNSNTDVARMGETFKYVAPIAGQLGFGVDDVAVSIGLLANAGIKGSMAGTTLRNIFTRLSTDAGATANTLGAMGILTERLGVSFYDSAGQARDWSTILGEARVAWKGLSQEEQVAYAKQIGSQRGMAGWLALMNASEEDFQQLTVAIEGSAGAAQNMADVRLDNLWGDLQMLNSSFDVLKVAIFDDVKGPLRDVVKFGTGAIDRIRDAFEKGSFEAGIKQLGTEIETFVTQYGPMFEQIGTTIAPLITTFLTTVSPAFINLGLTIGEAIGGGLIQGIQGALSQSGDGTMGVMNQMLSGLLKNFFVDPENPSMGNVWGAFGRMLGLGDTSGLEQWYNSRFPKATANENSNVTSQTVADTYTDLGFEYTGSVVKLGEFEFDPVALGSAAQEALNSPNATFTIGEGENSLQISTDYAQGILDFLSTIGMQASSQLSTDIGTSIETGGTGGASGMANAITSAGAGAASSVGNAIQAAISGRSYSINVSANVTGLPRNTTTEKHAKSMATGSILRGATVFGMNAEGQLMSGGESGAEAVVGVNSLNRMIQNSVNNAMLTKNTSSKSLSNTMRDSVAAGMSDYSTSFIDQLVARLSEVINAAVASIASRPNVVYMNGKSAAKQMADYNAIASSSRNRSIATGYGVAGLHKNTVNLMR